MVTWCPCYKGTYLIADIYFQGSIMYVPIHEREKIVVGEVERNGSGELYRQQSGTPVTYYSVCITVVGTRNPASSPIRKLQLQDTAKHNRGLSLSPVLLKIYFFNKTFCNSCHSVLSLAVLLYEHIVFHLFVISQPFLQGSKILLLAN